MSRMNATRVRGSEVGDWLIAILSALLLAGAFLAQRGSKVSRAAGEHEPETDAREPQER